MLAIAPVDDGDDGVAGGEVAEAPIRADKSLSNPHFPS